MKIQAIIHSLDGKMDTVELLGVAYHLDSVVPYNYIFKYNNQLVRGIINNFNLHYYVDDLYGVVPKYDENYGIYKKYLGVNNE